MDMQIDTTTAVSYFQKMGCCHSNQCNTLSRTIWFGAMERHIWLSACHIPGSTNIKADKESNSVKDNKEWKLDPIIFTNISIRFGKPDIDFFANTLNVQLPLYIS